MKSTIKLAVVGLAATMSFMAVAPVTVGATSYHHNDHHKNWDNHKKWNHKKDKPGSNIVETAIAVNKESGEFSTLIAAVSCTHLAEKLQNEQRKFTVFAPTDAAFAKLGLNAGNVCASFDKHTLTGILKYHVNRGEKDAAEVLSRKKLWMLNGEKAVISGATIDGVNIVQTDVKANNGIIHVIDGVMLP